jgi:hypothetical protein
MTFHHPTDTGETRACKGAETICSQLLTCHVEVCQECGLAIDCEELDCSYCGFAAKCPKAEDEDE